MTAEIQALASTTEDLQQSKHAQDGVIARLEEQQQLWEQATAEQAAKIVQQQRLLEEQHEILAAEREAGAAAAAAAALVAVTPTAKELALRQSQESSLDASATEVDGPAVAFQPPGPTPSPQVPYAPYTMTGTPGTTGDDCIFCGIKYLSMDVPTPPSCCVDCASSLTDSPTDQLTD